MMKNILKKIGIILIFGLFCIICKPITNAASDMQVSGLNILPELSESEIQMINAKIETIGSEGGHVRDHYNDEADGLTTSQQVASGIMNWDTIMNYLVFLVQFLSQLGLLVGALFIMYAGYMYVISLFKGGQVPKKTITNAIVGILVVIFSYAIMKILTSFIGLS